MSPQPDWGSGFVASFVAESKDFGGEDGVAGAFSGAFSGMNAKGFFADEAASGDAAARRFGFREGGGEKTNSGATGAAAAKAPHEVTLRRARARNSLPPSEGAGLRRTPRAPHFPSHSGHSSDRWSSDPGDAPRA